MEWISKKNLKPIWSGIDFTLGILELTLINSEEYFFQININTYCILYLIDASNRRPYILRTFVQKVRHLKLDLINGNKILSWPTLRVFCPVSHFLPSEDRSQLSSFYVVVWVIWTDSFSSNMSTLNQIKYLHHVQTVLD